MAELTGRRGIVFGVANDRSYAWHIAKALHEGGAEIAFAHYPGPKNARRVQTAVSKFGLEDPWCLPCDVGSDDDLDALFEQVGQRWEALDYVVHSVAMADKEYLQVGRFHETPRAAWNLAMDISAYSLVAIAHRAALRMPAGGAVLSLSYLGGERVVPGYNVMGIAKAALEHSTRYLAMELGRVGVRVNCISGAPLRTLSAVAVGNIEAMLDHQQHYSPLGRNIDGAEVGSAAAFLLSDAASAITGEVMHVDAGFHVLACVPCEANVEGIPPQGRPE